MTIETTSVNGQLAQHDPTGALTPSEAVTKAIHAWVSGLDIAAQGAEFVVDTPACPDSFWPLPPDVRVWQIPGKNPKLRLPDESEVSYLTRRRIAVQTVGFVVRYGLGLGLAPEVSLNGIFVIGGRPSMYAEQMVALVKSHGHGHRVIERTAERCTVEVRRRGETDWEQFAFGIDDAIRAGYVKGKGPNKDGKAGNDKYNLDPAAMLYARASSIACKTKFPDALRGMATYEELQDERSQDDGRGPTITTVTAQDIKTRTGGHPVTVHAVGRPDATAETGNSGIITTVTEPAASQATDQTDRPTGEGAAETGELITLPQSKRLYALLRKLDLAASDDKAAALAVISYIVERPVDSTKHLTSREATDANARLDELTRREEAKWRAEIRFMAAGGIPDATAPTTGTHAGSEADQ